MDLRADLTKGMVAVFASVGLGKLIDLLIASPYPRLFKAEFSGVIICTLAVDFIFGIGQSSEAGFIYCVGMLFVVSFL